MRTAYLQLSLSTCFHSFCAAKSIDSDEHCFGEQGMYTTVGTHRVVSAELAQCKLCRDPCYSVQSHRMQSTDSQVSHTFPFLGPHLFPRNHGYFRAGLILKARKVAGPPGDASPLPNRVSGGVWTPVAPAVGPFDSQCHIHLPTPGLRV